MIVNGRKQTDAERVADEINGRAIGIGADQSSLDEIRALWRRAEKQLGTVDVLVNNAAIAPRTAITRITDNEWNETLLVNLTAPHLATMSHVLKGAPAPRHMPRRHRSVTRRA